jgi:hypothetical protein
MKIWVKIKCPQTSRLINKEGIEKSQTLQNNKMERIITLFSKTLLAVNGFNFLFKTYTLPDWIKKQNATICCL